jgi:uncharacterized membrane protein YeaQ/YmgE (transglycosylase-associated protein family)
MMVVFFWITFGALVGWVACIMRGSFGLKVTLAHILLGAAGGLLGGYFSSKLATQPPNYDTSATSMIFAVFGAFLVIAIVSHTLDGASDEKR